MCKLSILAILSLVWVCSVYSSVPVLEETFNWKVTGGDDGDTDTSVRSSQISISDETLEDLKTRLNLESRLTAPLEDSQFNYGFNTDYLQVVKDFWLNNYDWRAREALLNQYNHYETTIEGLNIRFIHVTPDTSSNKTVAPLLLLHGWPGSIIEFIKTIPLLTADRSEYDFNFELVIPHLPGFGFSEGADKKGMDTLHIGKIFRKLMQRLGHEQFYVQGGDWGSVITTSMALLYPDNVKGIHLNFCVSFANKEAIFKQLVGSLSGLLPWNLASSKDALVEKLKFIIQETGFMHEQATKPDTAGVALNESPLGLAAWIMEKYSTLTNKTWTALEDGGLPGPFTMEELLDNVMMYWLSGDVTKSFRIYKENMFSDYYEYTHPVIAGEPVTVPSACAVFPNELVIQSESVIKGMYKNLVRYTTKEAGGHFAAFEQPEIFSEDVWESINLMENPAEKTSVLSKLTSLFGK